MEQTSGHGIPAPTRRRLDGGPETPWQTPRRCRAGGRHGHATHREIHRRHRVPGCRRGGGGILLPHIEMGRRHQQPVDHQGHQDVTFLHVTYCARLALEHHRRGTRWIPADDGTMPYVEVPGVRLWYSDTGGEGTPVILLHAASGTCESWVYQVPAFTAADYRCVAYDRRNWGRSRPTATGDQPGYVGDDLQGLVDHLGLDRFHLVATAAGGIGGLDYALEHPERVRSLVVANSIGGVQDPAYLEVQQRLRPPEIQALPIKLRELGPSYRGMDPEGTQRWIEIERSSRAEGMKS